MVGETPNLAARLQALAEPGSVVIARRPAACSAACSSWPTSARTRLKGFAEPVAAWRVDGRGPRRGPLRGAARRSASRRWSGASTSSASCSSAGRRAKDGEGQVVLLVGRARDRQVAPGPGAARAARRRAAHAAQPLLLALPHQQRAPPGDRAAGAGGAASTATIRRSASSTSSRRCSRRGDRPAGRGRCRCSRPCSAIPTGERYPALDLTPAAAEAADACRRWSTSSPASRPQQPVLVLLEDAHWVDPTTLELLGPA